MKEHFWQRRSRVTQVLKCGWLVRMKRAGLVWLQLDSQDRAGMRHRLRIGGAVKAGANRSAFPPGCVSDQLCCLSLDANWFGKGCLGQFYVQNAILQDRAHLQAVNLSRQINDP
jgi:hypothetical protein